VKARVGQTATQARAREQQPSASTAPADDCEAVAALEATGPSSKYAEERRRAQPLCRSQRILGVDLQAVMSEKGGGVGQRHK
jgi:hypothetical protein